MEENLLRILRLNNVFAPTVPAAEVEQPSQVEQMISQFPTRNNPGFGTKLAATFAGLGGGPKAAEQILYAPYHRQLEDWQAKFEPVYKQENLDRQIRQNENTFKHQNEQTRLKELQIENKAENDAAKLKIQQQRANAYDYKTRNPNHVIKEDEKGRLVAINPVTNETKYLVDGEGQPILTGNLSDFDKINLQIQGRLAVAEATSENAKELESQRQAGREGLLGSRTASQKELEELRQSNRLNLEGVKEKNRVTRSGGTENPSQIKVKEYNKAREAYNTHPEWQKFIKLGNPGTNDFQIIAPGTSLFGYKKTGPEQAEFDKMKEFIYGKGTQAPIPADKVKVKNPNGQVGMIPKSQLEAAKKQGFVEVK